MSQCKSCDGLLTDILDGDYHPACRKSKMDKTTYVDEKMDVATYPVNYSMPAEEETTHDQLSHLYSVLGGSRATMWVQNNVYNDVDLKDVYHKIMEGELTY